MEFDAKVGHILHMLVFRTRQARDVFRAYENWILAVKVAVFRLDYPNTSAPSDMYGVCPKNSSLDI